MMNHIPPGQRCHRQRAHRRRRRRRIRIRVVTRGQWRWTIVPAVGTTLPSAFFFPCCSRFDISSLVASRWSDTREAARWRTAGWKNRTFDVDVKE